MNNSFDLRGVGIAERKRTQRINKIKNRLWAELIRKSNHKFKLPKENNNE